jgi:hypothetical protein
MMFGRCQDSTLEQTSKNLNCNILIPVEWSRLLIIGRSEICQRFGRFVAQRHQTQKQSISDGINTFRNANLFSSSIIFADLMLKSYVRRINKGKRIETHR